jgi:hypothetical protein
MTVLTDYRKAVVADVERVGLRVSLDPRALNPPCVLVGVPGLVTLGPGPCAVSITMPVYLVAPPPGSGANITYLTEHLLTLMDAIGAREARAVELSVGDGQVPAPAYQCDLVTALPT